MTAQVDEQALAEAGLDVDVIAELLSRAQRDVDRGRVPACQLALARGGRAVCEATFGAASKDSRFVVFSVTKAISAGAVWVLLGDGRLRPETRVAEVVPGFGSRGMDAVTVEHLLTHTAGFPGAPMAFDDAADPQRRRQRFADWHLDWEPGSRTAYHASSAGWVLAEVVEQVTGTDHRRFVRERVLEPLGLEALRLGVPEDEQDDICEVTLVGAEPDAEHGRALESVLSEAGPAHLVRFNEPFVRALGVPGAGAVSTAGDVARYYQALLHGAPQVWSGEVLRDATGVVRNRHVDPMLGVPANRTLGLVVAGDDGNGWLRQFGEAVGPRAFGASGLGGQIAWGDPDTGLSFSYLTNGIDVDAARSFLRSNKLATLAARAASSSSG